MGGKVKNIENHSFPWFFALLGGSEEVSEASWGAVLAVSEASGGLSWTISEHFWTCWREDVKTY